MTNSLADLESPQIRAEAGDPSKRARILLVDDDKRNLLALSEVIEDIAEVVCANSGREALRHLLKGEFAVILLDVFMPGMDGYEVAKLIRERPNTARIPIIFISAVNKENEHLLRGYAMGAVDYVFKPVEPTLLKSKVSVFVDLFEMRREIEARAQQEQLLREENLRAELERLRAEQELRVAEQRQAALLSHLPLLLYAEPVLASPRVPHYVSGGSFDAMTGFTLAELQKNPHLFHERLHPDDRVRVEKALADRARTGAMAIEYRWQVATGEYKHLLDQGVVLRNDAGAPIEFAGTMLDVTERRNLETQLVQAGKMDAIGQLTGGVAHDFNNLLAVVLGGISLLERRSTLDERGKTIVSQMRHAAEKGTDLVRRMMAFARKQELHPTAIAGDLLCDSVAGLVQPTLGGRVSLNWDCGAVERSFFADQSQLELAMVNLIINARDAMPEGGEIKVAIFDADDASVAAAGLPEGDYLGIRIADQGTGIPQELLEKIAEPFFTTKELGKGTGLGLSMAMGFVQQSGGRLTISSALGSGTTIEILLPSTADFTGNERQRSDDEPSGPLTVRSLLLVDDDDGVRSIVKELLLDLDIEVTEAVGGTAAMELLRSGSEFDFVLTDYAMPGLNGLQLIRLANEIRPGIRSAIMTGYADEELGGSDALPILRKPICQAELTSVLRS
jgi:signal transduction histidine kinase